MMGATIPTVAAMLLQLCLGLSVFLANRKRTTNQCFLLFSFAVAGWLGGLLLAFRAATIPAATFAIRQASVGGAMYLLSLNLLRLSVRQRQDGWRGVFRHSKTWFVVTAGIIVLCQTTFFLKGAHFGQFAPTPIYGPGVNLYSSYFVLAFVVLIISYWRDLTKTTG